MRHGRVRPVSGDLGVAKDGSVFRGQAGKEFGLSLRKARDSLHHQTVAKIQYLAVQHHNKDRLSIISARGAQHHPAGARHSALRSAPAACQDHPYESLYNSEPPSSRRAGTISMCYLDRGCTWRPWPCLAPGKAGTIGGSDCRWVMGLALWLALTLGFTFPAQHGSTFHSASALVTWQAACIPAGVAAVMRWLPGAGRAGTRRASPASSSSG